MIIKCMLQGGAIEECSIYPSESEPWEIIFSGVNLERCRFQASDLFKALEILRLKLEETGAILLCAGSRPDVNPSGMSRSMGGGRLAYVIKVGEQTNRNEMVDIFDYAPIEMLGSVRDQVDFRTKWIDSLRDKLKS